MKKKIVALLLVGIMCMIQGAYAATMYSLDGRIIEVNDSEIEAYRQVNWFYGKPVTMYAADGRTLIIGENDIEMYEAVGWYTTPPMKTLYAADGRTAEFPVSEVAAQLTVGWYLEPVTLMYAADGRTLYVPNSEVTAYQNVGLYKTYSEAQASVRTYTYTSNSSQTESNYEGVYRTPTGKRYHFDSNCGGKNSYKTTLQKAKSAGLTPCKKCAW